jgi:predicted nucleic acid-binding protein
VIHLDANILIRLPFLASNPHPALLRIARGEPAGVCVLAWVEYVIGPARKIGDTELQVVRALIGGNIVSFVEADAELAGRLYNAAGRKRTLKTDACIAACAINADAEFLTLNAEDFRPFVAHGLRLLESSWP